MSFFSDKEVIVAVATKMNSILAMSTTLFYYCPPAIYVDKHMECVEHTALYMNAHLGSYDN